MRIRSLAMAGLLALTLAACSSGADTDTGGTDSGTGSASGTTDDDGGDSDSDGDDGGDESAAPGDGPTITVASFNFTESTILAELYAQALEDAGYSVERQLNLGSREVINPELFAGELDLLPEYVGSALTVGFGGEATSDLDESLSALREAYEAEGVQVLEPAPGEDKNVYVVTQQFADETGVSSISDLGELDQELTLAGPPECESRETCYLGLTEGPYELDNLQFEGIAEGAVRISALENGDVDVATLFSTQPVINEKGFVPLEDDQGLTAAENIVPVVSDEIVEAYGDDLVATLNEVTELITTDVLLDLNGRVELNAEDPADVATAFLQENGILG